MKSTYIIFSTILNCFLVQNIQAQKARLLTFTDEIDQYGNLRGKNMSCYIFESYQALENHNEFASSRVHNLDSNVFLHGSERSSHATAVASALLAAGIDPMAKGIAPEAKATIAPAHGTNPLLDIPFIEQYINSSPLNAATFTNQSYSGYPDGGVIHWGGYNTEASTYDGLMAEHPYWMAVTSVGNYGTSTNPNPAYRDLDLIPSGFSVSKNILTVANIADATRGSNGYCTDILVAATSSVGPTDDLRIKPEIGAPGTDVKAADYINNDPAGLGHYDQVTGSSFASPVVMGGAMLMQELWAQLYNKASLKASTLKGLLIHTATKVTAPSNPTLFIHPPVLFNSDNDGPDPVAGYGLLNIKNAHSAIVTRGNGSIIEEMYQNDMVGPSIKQIQLPIKAGKQVIASICWTDDAGPVTANGNLNISTPVLVNDFDMRIIETSPNSPAKVLFPYKLQNGIKNIPNSGFRGYPITVKGDNVTDNFELIRFIPLPECTYVLQVTHKGSFVTSKNYSLIVTGLDRDETKNICPVNLNENGIRASSPVRSISGAQKNLDSSQQITAGSESVYLRAGEQILLSEGFNAKNDLYVYIGSCSEIIPSTQASSKMTSNETMTKADTDMHTSNVQNSLLKIYPNPSSDYLFAEIGINEATDIVLSFKDAHIDIYDHSGKLLRKIAVHDKINKIDVLDLPQGIYLLTLKIGNQEAATAKFIKK